MTNKIIEKSVKIGNGIKLFCLLVVIIVMACVAVIGAMPSIPEINIAEFKGGEASGFDYGADLFVVGGEWEFYPSRILYSSDFADFDAEAFSFTQYRDFPHYWRDDPVMPNGTGYATYRMVVNMPFEPEGAGIFTKIQYGAYRIYINGDLICEGGNISENNRDEYFFAFNGSYGHTQKSPDDSYEVIVQLQSYDHVDAGLTGMIIMGSPDSVTHFGGFLKVITGIAIGALLVLLFHFLLIYIRNMDKGEYLNLAIISLCGLYLVLTNLGESHAYYATPEVHGRLIYALEYVALAAGMYLATARIIRRNIKFKHTGKIIVSYTFLKTAVLLILPPYQVSAARPLIYISAFAFVGTALILSVMRIIKDKRKKKRNNYVLLEGIGILILLCGALLNVLGVMLFMTFDLFPFSIIIFCFIEVFVLSQRYRSAEQNLINARKELEVRAIERAADLKETNRRVEAAVSLKSEFLTRMTREMLLPMNAIVGISELFDTDNLSETQKNYFRDIKETTSSLLGFINDIIDFSQIEAGKLELSSTHFNLNTFIENICSAAEISARHKNLKFDRNISDGLPEVIYGDETRMKQVIATIVGNAVKYTKEGGVNLRIEAETKSGGSFLLFSVSDTGVGIRKENIPRLFDAFTNFEASSSKERGLKIRGLGLTICRRLMEMQKGIIEFDSKEGRGSIFKLYFPLVPGDKNLIEKTSVSEKIYAKNAKILVVEDNSINVTVTLGILATHDIHPDVAKGGYKALRMVRERDYDLILMDLYIPDMDGIEITQRIREMGGKYASIPIIAVTANITRGVREMLIFKGMNDYISKPIDQNSLNNILSKWLPNDKITSARGRFENAKHSDLLSRLPLGLIEITEINFSEALSNMKGNLDIYMGLLYQLAREADDYADNLTEYLKTEDDVNYSIVINGIKNLLYGIGAKSYGDMARQIEDAAVGKNREFCKAKNNAFCDRLRWLSQRVALALPPRDENETDVINNPQTRGETKLDGIIRALTGDFSIGDCDAIDKNTAALKELGSFDEEHDKIISKIIKAADMMEYEDGIRLCEEFLSDN